MKANPVLIICMGVSGSGKSTLAQALAPLLEMKYFEADDFHSPENRARMAAGQPLNDVMREPWIDSMCDALKLESQSGQNCILAYSGLRSTHRQRFRKLGFRTLFLHLEGAKEVIAGRMHDRQNHFMAATLLDSQYRDLESADGESDVLALDIADEPPLILDQAQRLVMQLLKSGSLDDSL